MTFSVPALGTKAVTQAKKGARNKPAIKLLCCLCVCNGIFLTEISKYMPPDVASSQTDDQLACMHGYVTCHHDQIADNCV